MPRGDGTGPLGDGTPGRKGRICNGRGGIGGSVDVYGQRKFSQGGYARAGRGGRFRRRQF